MLSLRSPLRLNRQTEEKGDGHGQGDFIRIIGASEADEYAPVAGMLQNGYGFVGYFNTRLNQDLRETVLIMNARLVDLRGKAGTPGHPHLFDFNDFVEEIVKRSYRGGQAPISPTQDHYGKSIPLTALNLDQIAAVYPITQINKLMAEIGSDKKAAPSFLDFDNKSVILKALRTKIW